MHLVKHLFSLSLRAGSLFLGGMLIFSALGSTALALAPPDAPEIDPGTLSSGFALLAGGFLLLTSRRRRK